MAPKPIPIESVFYALSDPTRRAILGALRHGPQSVSALASPLNVTLTAVAQHLQVLQVSGLVRTKKTGRVRTCSLQQAGFAVLEQWISSYQTVWDQKLDKLGQLLEEE